MSGSTETDLHNHRQQDEPNAAERPCSRARRHPRHPAVDLLSESQRVTSPQYRPILAFTGWNVSRDGREQRPILPAYLGVDRLMPLVISAFANAHLRSESANSEYRAVMRGVRCPKALISAVVGTPAMAEDRPK